MNVRLPAPAPPPGSGSSLDKTEEILNDTGTGILLVVLTLIK